jgi:CRP-like cAMP-binding protein
VEIGQPDEGRTAYRPSDASRVRGGLLSEALATFGREGGSFQHVDRRLLAVVLKEVPLFARLGVRDLRHLAEAVTVTHLAADESVVREGFSAEGFFVVLTGQVVVRRSGEPDRSLARGAWFGELGLLDAAPRTARGVTLTDAWLMKLARNDFLALLDRHASIGRGVAEGLAARLRSVYDAHDGTADA